MSAAIAGRRAAAQAALTNGRRCARIVVTDAAAATDRIADPAVVARRCLSLALGDIVEPEDFAQRI